ncbi:anti-sigma factor [Massilia sp. CF038]|uniref:anti-sigma factor family protein n=1 Tax=Massilia sp. CF038 TaxID=1881045 RepID=UPI00091DC19D|nr:hypothetical protein [Massilia sp. CF038]SHG39536.1 hypothetical protein SAMN05428948_0245 [Massilia sp. CF038]
MSFSDETLMAFADGELDDITSHEVELAMRLDPAIAEKVRLHQALRSNVFGAFAQSLDEEVPQRLQAAVRSGKVIHLDNVRQLRTPPPAPQPVRVVKRAWSWPEWGALAATLVAGVLAGIVGARSLGGGQQFAAFDPEAGALTAQGRLATALAQQLSLSAPRDKDVRVGLSFISRQGEYCRTFLLPTTAGLACRSGAHWRIPVLASSADSKDGAYRLASSEMPPAVMQAVDELIVGKALDLAGEKAAQRQGWAR